jgi:hypothetical protein
MYLLTSDWEVPQREDQMLLAEQVARAKDDSGNN